MWHTGLVALWHVGASRIKARTRVPCISRQILNHCTTREALPCIFKYSHSWDAQLSRSPLGVGSIPQGPRRHRSGLANSLPPWLLTLGLSWPCSPGLALLASLIPRKEATFPGKVSPQIFPEHLRLLSLPRGAACLAIPPLVPLGGGVVSPYQEHLGSGSVVTGARPPGPDRKSVV